MPRATGTNDRSGLQGFQLTQDAWERLVFIEPSGARHVDVLPVRSFPIADPQHWISIVDAVGHELVLIEDPQMLPAEVRETLERALTRAEFVPRIQRIIAASPQNDPAVWEIETDRGRVEITIQNETDVRRLGTHGALVVDCHGIRFLIPDSRKLDSYSRRVLERFV
jgi:Domain of unknown function (DUF1854)